MGFGGTAAARENADIIILDDSFYTIFKVSYMICMGEMTNSVYRMQCNKLRKHFLAVRFPLNNLATLLKAYMDNAGYPMVSISIHQYPDICPIPAHCECLSRGHLCVRGCVL